MRNYIFAASLVLAASLTACGGGSDAKKDPQRVSLPKGLSGTLYFERNEPGEYAKVMTMDLKTGRYKVTADGFDASTHGDRIAYLQLCSPLAVRVALTDSDGFDKPISECYERGIARANVFAPSLSPNGKHIAVANSIIPLPKDELGDDLASRMRIGGQGYYAATQIYTSKGDLKAELRGMGASTWTQKNDLIVAGLTDDSGYGIYRVSKNFKKTTRLDDGRIEGAIYSIAAHPKKNRVAFIYNGQIFEMDLKNGTPKRIHSHGFPLAAVTYSPDGKAIAFVSGDPLDEAIETPGGGYPMYIKRGDDVELIRAPFIPGGPLTWVK